MKKLAIWFGFVCMLTFPVFIWLSHTGVMQGSEEGHFWGGLGFLIFAFAAFLLICYMTDNTEAVLIDNLFSSYGIVLIFNFIAYAFLRSAELIGPFLREGINPDAAGAVFLGIFYLVLAILGGMMFYFSLKN